MDFAEKILTSKEFKSIYYLILVGGGFFIVAKGLQTFYDYRRNVTQVKLNKLDIQIKENQLAKEAQQKKI